MGVETSVRRTYYWTRRYVYELFTPNLGGFVGKCTDWGIVCLIFLSVIAVILETVDPIATKAGPFFRWFEVFTAAVFTIEYVGRVWSTVEDGAYESPVFGRLHFAKQPLVIIDLVAILPFYLGLLSIGVDLRFLRALRLVRLFRLLKLARYSESLQAFITVVVDKKEQLVLAFGANIMLLVLGSSIMYYIEHPNQPEAFSSIPAAFWWGIATQTTVGYGDITPVTPLGRFVGGVFALVGIGLFALPAAILASGFMDVVEDDDGTYDYCPHCGEELHE